MTDRYAEARPDAEPQKVTDLPGQAPMEGEEIAAQALIGQSFVILKAKRMTSTKGKEKGPGYFYLCQIKRQDGRLYRTLLGGVAVVPVLDAWAAQESPAPLAVTLRQISGGEFGKYYILE